MPIPLQPPISNLAEVKTQKAEIEAGMEKIIIKMKTSQGSNPVAITEAETLLALFKDHFVATSVEIIPEGMRVKEAETCSNTPCFAFTMADTQTGVIGTFDHERGAIAFSPSIKGNDPYAPFVIFHELSHARDRLEGRLMGSGINTPAIPNTENPTEIQAHGFEAELLNGATHGGYYALGEATGQAIIDRKIDFIGVMPGPVTFFDIPNELYWLIGDKTTMSEAGRQALAMNFLILVNRILVPPTRTSQARRSCGNIRPLCTTTS